MLIKVELLTLYMKREKNTTKIILIALEMIGNLMKLYI